MRQSLFKSTVYPIGDCFLKSNNIDSYSCVPEWPLKFAKIFISGQELKFTSDNYRLLISEQVFSPGQGFIPEQKIFFLKTEQEYTAFQLQKSIKITT